VIHPLITESKLKKFENTFSAYLDWFSSPAGSGEAWCHREAYAVKDSFSGAFPRADWPFPIRVTVGRELLNRLVYDTTINIDRNGNLADDDRN
jgi:hypothetical protein